MKFLKKLMIPILVVMGLSFNGCIFDNLETIPLNIPITLDINVSGSQDPVSESETICLSESELYQDYQNKINDINLLEITFRAQSVNPSPLTGNVTVAISANGSQLINYTFNDVTLDDTSVYTLNLTQQQLQAIDAMLANNVTCFDGAVTISNITPEGQRSLVATIDFVFQAESEI